MAEQGFKGSELKEQVAEMIKAANPGLSEKVVQHFVDVEIAKRTKMIVQAVEKLNTMIADRKKLNKPDVVTVESLEDGATKHERFSPDRQRQAKGLDEKIAKLDAAIAKALGPDADYQGVEKAIQGDGGQQGKAAGGGTTE